MATADVPDFLTVDEAARVLRIGRTAAYQQAHRWLATGTEGLPVLYVGGSLRSPRAQFEAHFNVRITAIPPRPHRPKPAGPGSARPAQDIPRAAHRPRRTRSGESGESGLPFPH